MGPRGPARRAGQEPGPRPARDDSVVAGAGLTTPIAYRWKTQVNENAKMPAYALELPEMDHNEIVGWSSARRVRPLLGVFLDDPDMHPRVKERIDLTRALIAPGAAGVHRVESRGQTTAERVFSLVLLGDLVSIPRRAARHRPRAGGGPRPPEGRARRRGVRSRPRR